MLPGVQITLIFFAAFQDLPTCFSDVSSIKIKFILKKWKSGEGGEQKY
jgi:hypothetical protein